MSYLSQSLRLHFAGRFQATVSTVNNDVTHFDNANFKPNYQDRQTKTHPNGWWNPDGDGVWRLLGCGITAAYMADGTAVPGTDPVLGMSIADSDNSAPAKIVDLDPQQQLVSTIFGLQVRISTGNGDTLMRGKFDPAAFTDLWGKVNGATADMAYGAMWQSVITVTEWGDISASPFLTELKTAADANGNLLSIKFNVDCYSLNWPTAGTEDNNQFCRGRLVGTIGPATTTEPRHFVLGRQLLALQQQNQAPAGKPPQYNPWINYCAAVVDTTANVVRVDLGNALQVDGKGAQANLGTLTLVVSSQDGSQTETLGIISYSDANWYNNTAGIVEVPIPSGLTLSIGSNSLGLTLTGTQLSGVITGEPLPALSGNDPAVTVLNPGGLYLRADLFVYRLSPGQSQTVNFYATQYGLPYANQTINLSLGLYGLQGTTDGSDGGPPLLTPASGLCFPSTATTDSTGKAVVTLTGGNPENARGYIDGQLYAIGYVLANQATSYPGYPAALGDYPTDSFNFVSILVFDDFVPDNPIAWRGTPQGSLQPIFQQYANLYPVMARFVNLGDYNQVKSYAGMLSLAFSLPDDDANAMPVTRDLSPAKRAAILQWLKNPIEVATEPLFWEAEHTSGAAVSAARSRPPAAAVAAHTPAAAAPADTADDAPAPRPVSGSKALAMTRRASHRAPGAV